MHEIASVTTLQVPGSISVRLVDIDVAGVSFVTLEALPCAPADQLSLRFTLPGRPRLHFAMIGSLRTVEHDAPGYRYEASFVRTDPHTIDHILQCIRPSGAEAAKDSGSLHLH